MAPEQADGKTTGPLTDVYALGAVLYELLTGRPPFRAPTRQETLDQVRYNEPVPPAKLQPKIPRDLETICLKCLAKESGQRYASASALADDLHRFLAGEPIQARRVPAWERGLKWARRRPAVAALVVVSAIALASPIAGFLLYEEDLRHAAEQEARKAKLESITSKVKDRLADGRDRLPRGELEEARVSLQSAVVLVQEEPALQDLGEEAADLLQQVNEAIAAAHAYEQFGRERDRALFHATLATGQGLPAHITATRDAARQALVLAQSAGSSPRLAEAEKAELTARCYELLLVLAEAEATPLLHEHDKEQIKQALNTLARAETLGYQHHPTQAYLLRRARYVEADKCQYLPNALVAVSWRRG
jgi:hypothetical protein